MTLPCDEYINCPGQDRKGGCTNVIPQVISCTGANKGKHYQRCEICGYFWWIPPSVLFGTSPSPSPSPVHPSGFNGHRPFSSMSSTSTPTPPPIPQPIFVPLSQPAKAPKPMCSGTSCYTPQTLACSKNMCKKCCERAPGVCMYKGHNGGQRPYSSSSNPAHLRRPVPAIPLCFAEPAFDPQLFASPSNTPTPELPASTDGFTFRKAVLPDLLEDTQRRWAERDAQASETVSRAENERRIKHSVFLAVYLEENMPPDTIPLQGINTWPTLCLAQIPTLSSLLNGIDPASLELLIEKTGTWTSLSFAFKVNTDDTITIRRKGLTSLGLSSPKKRKLSVSSPSPPSKICRTDSPPTNSLATSSPAPMHTLSFLEELELDIIDLSQDLPSTPALRDARDRTWDEGYVFVPPLATKKWPNGMYARDMAQGFGLLAAGSGRLDEHFPQVFPGVPFSSSTYQLNRKFWKALTVGQQEAARNLPRIEAGLWSEWRKKQSVWKSIK